MIPVHLSKSPKVSHSWSYYNGGPYKVGPTVYTKQNYIFTYFYLQYLVLFTMVPRNRRGGGLEHPDMTKSFWSRACSTNLDGPPCILLTFPQFKGKYEEADHLFAQAIEIGENTLGPDHLCLATWSNNWAGLLHKQVRVNGIST